MARYKRVLNLKLSGSDQTIKIVQALSELKADIVADSTPSSIKITIHGTKEEIRDISRKVIAIAKQSKSS
jgi:hypothetical protein